MCRLARGASTSMGCVASDVASRFMLGMATKNSSLCRYIREQETALWVCGGALGNSSIFASPLTSTPAATIAILGYTDRHVTWDSCHCGVPPLSRFHLKFRLFHYRAMSSLCKYYYEAHNCSNIAKILSDTTNNALFDHLPPVCFPCLYRCFNVFSWNENIIRITIHSKTQSPT